MHRQQRIPRRGRASTTVTAGDCARSSSTRSRAGVSGWSEPGSWRRQSGWVKTGTAMSALQQPAQLLGLVTQLPPGLADLVQPRRCCRQTSSTTPEERNSTAPATSSPVRPDQRPSPRVRRRRRRGSRRRTASASGEREARPARARVSGRDAAGEGARSPRSSAPGRRRRVSATRRAARSHGI